MLADNVIIEGFFKGPIDENPPTILERSKPQSEIAELRSAVLEPILGVELNRGQCHGGDLSISFLGIEIVAGITELFVVS